MLVAQCGWIDSLVNLAVADQWQQHESGSESGVESESEFNINIKLKLRQAINKGYVICSWTLTPHTWSHATTHHWPPRAVTTTGSYMDGC
jgi:hypothetical protein